MVLDGSSLLAHAAKSDRLKQAKADADKEVAAYKAEREAAYKEKMASVRSTGQPLYCTEPNVPNVPQKRHADSAAVCSLSTAYLVSLIKALPPMQNSSSAGDTVERLGAESDDQVQQIQKNVGEHKKAVSEANIRLC